MAANERVRNIQVHRPIIYGSHARLLTDEEKLSATQGHTHRWTVFLTSATSPPPPKASSSSSSDPPSMDYIPGDADDLSYLVKKVTFRLHETYANANRVCDKPPFKVTETGWGEFVVGIRLQFVQESGEKPMTLSHPIKLHHWGPPIEAAQGQGQGGALPTPSSGQQGSGEGGARGTPGAAPLTPAPTPAGNRRREVKSEVNTPAGEDGGDRAGGGGEDEADADAEGEAGGEGETGDGTGGAGDAGDEADRGVAVQPDPEPISIAAKYPVHSWQYDELVFTDPPANFLALLNQHPPTPLPAKNRRPRDQREQHEASQGGAAGGTGRKKLKSGARPSGVGVGANVSVSRDVTAEPDHGSVAGTTSTPAPPAPVGIVGEPGSADVPLEFSVEMEKAEWNRLNDTRVRMVEEMDRWRERLIVQEKELAKLKEEMGVA